MEKWATLEDDSMRLMYQCFDCGAIIFQPYRSPTVPVCDFCDNKPMDYFQTQYLLPQPKEKV